MLTKKCLKKRLWSLWLFRFKRCGRAKSNPSEQGGVSSFLFNYKSRSVIIIQKSQPRQNDTCVEGVYWMIGYSWIAASKIQYFIRFCHANKEQRDCYLYKHLQYVSLDGLWWFSSRTAAAFFLMLVIKPPSWCRLLTDLYIRTVSWINKPGINTFLFIIGFHVF